MMSWLNKLGYDNDLFPVRSRNFVISIHSNETLEVQIYSAIQSDLDSRVSVMVCGKFGVIEETNN